LHLVGFFMWIILWCTDPRTSSSHGLDWVWTRESAARSQRYHRVPRMASHFTFRIVCKVVTVRSELNLRQTSLLRSSTGTLGGYLPRTRASRNLLLRKDTPSSPDTRLNLCSLHSGYKQTATGGLSHEEAKQECFTDTQSEAGMFPQVRKAAHNSCNYCSDFDSVLVVVRELLYKATSRGVPGVARDDEWWNPIAFAP